MLQIVVNFISFIINFFINMIRFIRRHFIWVTVILLLSIGVISIVGQRIENNVSMVYVETAQYETIPKTLNTKAYILRNESYITNDSGGVLSYNIEDCDAIEKGGVIANVYENETDAINAINIKKLNSEIENLRKINTMSNVVGASLESINKSLNTNIQTFISDTKNNNFTEVSKSLDGLLYSMNEKQIITGKVTDFNERIETLQNEKLVLEQSVKPSIGQITSGIAGVFTSHTDGYENLFDYTQVRNMTYPQLVNIQEANVKEPSQNIIGKVISQVNWYLCCPIGEKDVESLGEISDKVEIYIPYVSTTAINAELITVNNDYNSGCAVAIFECKDMNITLSKIRNEEVNIAVKKYEGIKIPKKAIYTDKVTRTVDNEDGTTRTEEAEVKGVYILHGNELKFREIVTLYETEEFVLCDSNEENENLFSHSTVKLYDKIVMEGTDLYAGKIVMQSAEIE